MAFSKHDIESIQNHDNKIPDRIVFLTDLEDDSAYLRIEQKSGRKISTAPTIEGDE